MCITVKLWSAPVHYVYPVCEKKTFLCEVFDGRILFYFEALVHDSHYNIVYCDECVITVTI